MAVGTITLVKRANLGSLKATIYDVVGPASYTTGGDSLTAANLGLKKIYFAKVSAASGWKGEYDITNSKLMAFGDGANTGTTTTGTALPQAASATNLGSVTFRVFAVGY